MNWFWDNIHLKKEERLGMSIFICILFCLLMIKWYLVVVYVPKGEYNNSDLIANMEFSMIESFTEESKTTPNIYDANQKSKILEKKNKRSKVSKKKIKTEKTLFVFDPNTISKDSLMLMGVSKYAANNIAKYRDKGGRFNSAKDLQKVYGLDSLTYSEIYSFIKISKPKRSRPVEKIKEKVSEKAKPIVYSKPKLELKSIDINRADTTEFKKLDGIGSVYSKRIIKFRNSLGGYFTIDQIKDVWGISDSLFVSIKPYLSVDPSSMQKRDINSLDKEEMVKHPYIDWKKAKIILKYKKMHGDYKSMDDFRKMHGVDEAFVDTLTHYFEAL